jgi:iron complex outermembrane receptor protein
VTRSRWVTAIALPLLIVGLPAWAEKPAPEEDNEPEKSGFQEYVEVNEPNLPTSNTIATKLPTPLQLTPANVGTVSAPLFEEQDAVLLGDSLVNVSGINVQTQAGVHDFFVIRGFDSVSGSLILTDGASEPEATNYPLYNVAGVEVLKGPAGFLYGSDPLAGVVNIVRKQPLPTSFAVFGGSVGSFSTKEATVDWNLANQTGDRSFRLNTFWRESDGYRDDKDNAHLAINPSFAWQLGADSSINVNLEYVDAEYTPDTGLPLTNNEIPDVPRERNYQTPFDFSDQTISRLQVDYETKISEAVSLRNKTYYRDLDWQSNGTQFIRVDPVGDDFLVSRTLTTLDDRQEFVGNQFEAILSLRSGSVSHGLLAGLELTRRTDDFDIGNVPPFNPDPNAPPLPTIPPISLFNPVETALEVPALPLLVGNSEVTVIAPYLIDQMKLSRTVQLLLGARFDIISRDDERSLLFRPESVSRDDSELSPMLGVVFAPTSALSLYANAGSSFAPASPRVFGDSNLEPEDSTQYEVGVKKQFLDDRVRTTFALYQIERENIAIPDDSGVTLQAGDQRSRGFEFELAAEPLPRLRTFLSYAYNDSELTRFNERIVTGPGLLDFVVVDRSGNRPAFAPENLLNAWVSKSFAGGLGVGGGVRFIDDQFIAEDNAFEIDSAVIFDAAVFYDLNVWRFRLNLKNLTDEDYEVRGFGSTSVIPAAERSAYFSVEFRL